MARRIIPVSSGKGGVGKTTFALNFALALSRVGKTVLVDLDTGTSSVRNTLSVPVDRDLYHFHRKGVPLADCITTLDDDHDPDRRFRNFGFVAGPKHFIDDLANPDEAFRRKIAAAVNQLEAEYIIVDLRAGLDAQVIDFLPFTNSGVLVFAPHHPAATLAAADIVKATIFRSLRVLFADDSRFYHQPGLYRFRQTIHDLLDKVEDVYEESVVNLDAFLVELEEAFGDHPILRVIGAHLDSFRVHYVLNMFNGVEESYREAIEPFVRNLTHNVSTRLDLTQLGWIVYDERVHRANCSGYPVVLGERPKQPAKEVIDPVLAELQKIEASVLGLERKPKKKRRRIPRPDLELLDTEDLLAGQLRTLSALYGSRSNDTVRENFAYLTHRALALMAPGTSPSEFGQLKLSSREQLLDWFLDWQRGFAASSR